MRLKEEDYSERGAAPLFGPPRQLSLWRCSCIFCQWLLLAGVFSTIQSYMIVRKIKCIQEKQGTLPPFFNLPHSSLLPSLFDNCIYFTLQLLQVNNIVLSGNIYLEEESYPNTADNLSKDK